MIRDIVYGTKGDKTGYGQYVEVFMFDEDNHLGIDVTNDGHIAVYHFLIKDKSDYEDFRDELIAVLKDCSDINMAHSTLEVYLDSPYADDFLEEYPEGDEAMKEFESRATTVEDYLKVRDLMVGERNIKWAMHENGNFEDDNLAELIEAYDFVIDSLTCLAMETDKSNKK